MGVDRDVIPCRQHMFGLWLAGTPGWRLASLCASKDRQSGSIDTRLRIAKFTFAGGLPSVTGPPPWCRTSQHLPVGAGPKRLLWSSVPQGPEVSNFQETDAFSGT